VVRALEQTADVLTTARLRPIEHLYMLGQVTPMMGLLGTVYGIILAFRAFVASGGHASPVLLAGGIGTALVATFWGLVVAIPALAAYAVLRNKVDELTLQATHAAAEMLNQFRPRSTTTAKSAAAPVAAAAS
jgi:biopolymer transport protein ExbB